MGFQVVERILGIATLRQVSPVLVEIHYHPGVKLTASTVAQVQAERRAMMGAGPYATFTIIPADVDYHIDTMSRDQGKADRDAGGLLACAVVAKASTIEMLTRLYLSYFPPKVRFLVSPNEADARKWLEAQIAELFPETI